MADKPLLYHMPQTRGGTTLFMDQELGGVCDLRIINLRKGEGRSSDYLKLNPMGKIPTLLHNGVIITEAAAICAYLAELYPHAGLAPAATDPARGLYYRWMFFAPSVIEPMMLDKLGGVERTNATAAGHGDYARAMASIELALSKRPWLLGEKFSAADVVMGSTLMFATMFGAIPKEGRIAEYVDQIAARPAHQKMMRMNADQAKALGL